MEIFCHISPDLVSHNHQRTLSVLQAKVKSCFRNIYNKYLNKYHSTCKIFRDIFTFLISFLLCATCGSSAGSSPGFVGVFPNLTLDSSSTGSSGLGIPFLILGRFGVSST